MTAGGAGAATRRRAGGPVFVVGSMRSGSTMLRLILDSHPAIAIGPETGFMGSLRHAKDNPGWKFGHGWYTRLGWTEQEMDQRLREFYGGMFQRYAEQQGKPRWGEKTPFHTAHMAEMARIFPDAVLVGIVRHPGAVAASLRKNFHYGFDEALSYWTATNLDLVRAGAQLGGRFSLCRYEDLVVAGEPVLRELLTLVGETWHADVMEHHRVQRDKGAPRAAEGGTVSHDAVDAGRAVHWTEGLADQDYTALETTGPLAGFFGYDAVRAAPSEPLGLHAGAPSWMLTGDDLAGRMAQWAGRVDFAAQPNVVVVDASAEELAERLARAEAALARTRSRRAVRVVDACRKVQHGRTMGDVRDAWALLRGNPHAAG